MCMEKIIAGGSQSSSPSPRPETCSICSRSVTQRSPWASSRVMGFHECNVVGVLVCGHTYHTECLDQITPDSSRQDPACPRCSSNSSEKVVVKKSVLSLPPTLKAGTVRGSSFMSRPSPRNKLSRIGVLDDSVSLGKPRFPQVLQGNLPLDHFLLEAIKVGIDWWHVHSSTGECKNLTLWRFGAMQLECRLFSFYWSNRLLLPPGFSRIMIF